MNNSAMCEVCFQGKNGFLLLWLLLGSIQTIHESTGACCYTYACTQFTEMMLANVFVDSGVANLLQMESYLLGTD